MRSTEDVTLGDKGCNVLDRFLRAAWVMVADDETVAPGWLGYDMTFFHYSKWTLHDCMQDQDPLALPVQY